MLSRPRHRQYNNGEQGVQSPTQPKNPSLPDRSFMLDWRCAGCIKASLSLNSGSALKSKCLDTHLRQPPLTGRRPKCPTKLILKLLCTANFSQYRRYTMRVPRNSLEPTRNKGCFFVEDIFSTCLASRRHDHAQRFPDERV